MKKQMISLIAVLTLCALSFGLAGSGGPGDPSGDFIVQEDLLLEGQFFNFYY